MKIKSAQINGYTEVANVKQGECFVFRGRCYMMSGNKQIDYVRVVNLKTGDILLMCRNEMVYPIVAEVVMRGRVEKDN